MIRKLKKYRAIITAGFKTGIAYRLHYFVSLFSVPVNLIIYYYLWKAIYEYSQTNIINGFTLQGLVSYYVIAMVVSFITWTDVDNWIETDIIHGYMTNALMKPMSYFSWNVCFTIGLNWLGILIQLIPVIIISNLFGLSFVTGWHILLFITSIIIAIGISFMIAYLVGLSAFWLNRITGLRRVRRVVVAFLAGSLLPLSFFPETIQKVFGYLPFTHILYNPVQIYLQHLTIQQALTGLLYGATWLVILYAMGRLIWKQAFKKYTGVGT